MKKAALGLGLIFDVVGLQLLQGDKNLKQNDSL